MLLVYINTYFKKIFKKIIIIKNNKIYYNKYIYKNINITNKINF
jgi:hypothetical protein